MSKNIKNDIILEKICAASIDIFAYTLYRIDKYVNPYRDETTSKMETIKNPFTFDGTFAKYIVCSDGLASM